MKASNLKVNDNLTIFQVSPLAFSVRREMVVKAVIIEKNYIHFSYKGKRKLYGFSLDKLENSSVVFLNTKDIPFMLDTEAGPKSDGKGYSVHEFHGNALINFSGDIGPQQVRDYIEGYNKNPKLDYGYITYNHKLLYPETETYHSVVSGMKERNEVW